MHGILVCSERLKVSKAHFFNLAYGALLLKEIFLKKANIGDIIPGFIINIFSNLCSAVLFLCLLAMLIGFQKYTLKSVVLYGTLIATFMISMHKSGTSSIFIALMMMLCCQSIDFERLGGVAIKILTAILLVTAALAITGTISMGIRYRSFSDDTTRYALGFNHPNVFALLVFQWLSLFLYLRRKEPGTKKYFIYIIVETVAYLVSNSNTFFITATILLVMEIGYQFLRKHFSISETKQKVLWRFVLIVFFVITFFAIRHWWIHPEVLSNSFRTFMARFTLSKKYIAAYGIHLFGNHIVVGPSVQIPGFQSGYFYLDNGYVRLLVEHGLIVFLCFVGVLITYFRALIRIKDWDMIIVTICLMFYIFCEAKVISIPFNIFLINIGIVLFNSLEKKNTDDEKLD